MFTHSERNKAFCVHHIQTTGPPIQEKSRRLSLQMFKATQAEFQYILEQGICLQSSSPWSRSLHMVPKKSAGTWRPCDDYRRINAITTTDRYPVANLAYFSYKLHGTIAFIPHWTFYKSLYIIKSQWQKKKKGENCSYHSIWLSIRISV